MSANLYVATADFKLTLNIGSTYADADVVMALESASRCCDAYKDTRFWATTESRYYTGCPSELELDIDAANTVTSVDVDYDGNQTYETNWATTAYYPAPVNAPADGLPYKKIILYRQGGRRFPIYDNAVKVTGSFGWAAIPPNVKEATTILAGRFLKRARETPYGLVVLGHDAEAAARLGRIDPDVAFLLDNIPANIPTLAV